MTPVQNRDLTPTQSDLDFIATDEEDDGLYVGDDDYHPSTAEDNDEEEEELLSELLQSGKLSDQQSDRVRTRLRMVQRERAIARTLFALKQNRDKPGMEEQPTSISPPVTAAPANRMNATTSPQPPRGPSPGPATPEPSGERRRS